MIAAEGQAAGVELRLLIGPTASYHRGLRTGGAARSGVKVEARSAVGLVLVGGFLLMLGAGLPGHLSFDSIAQLHEGHLHVRETWGPAIYVWLLGFFDGIIPGAGLYVVASALLLFVSLISLCDLRPAT